MKKVLFTIITSLSFIGLLIAAEKSEDKQNKEDTKQIKTEKEIKKIIKNITRDCSEIPAFAPTPKNISI